VESERPIGSPSCLYLYGIVRAGPLELSAVAGIEGRCDVSLVSFGELACAISPVPLSEYGEQPMSDHAQQLDWIAPRALRHQDVVQRLRQAGAVIPLKFGTLCSAPQGVQELLERHCEPLLRLLEHLRGRDEWGVKVYAGEGLASRAVERAGPRAQVFGAATSPVSEGEAYFLKKKRQRLASEQRDLFLSELANEIYERLLPCAVDGRKSRFLDLSRKAEQVAVLNAAFLVEELGVARFQSAIERLEADYRDCGATFELSGPWAPYSFCGDLTTQPGGGPREPCGG
jgi:hypothetical protein